jgi:Helix-turn-helix domain
MINQVTKVARLTDDEFNPQGNISNFCQLPRGVLKSKSLSAGAKLLYATLIGFNVKGYGTVFPKKSTLREAMGYPSLKTLYRWQNELVNVGLIRVHQKGKGLPNNYYFLRSPMVDNAAEGEFEEGGRFRHINWRTGERQYVNESDGRTLFQMDVESWLEWGDSNPDTFPKPCWKFSRKKYNLYKEMCCIIASSGVQVVPSHDQVF